MAAHIDPFHPTGLPGAPSFDLTGRSAVVTGGCGPIGRAICHGLAHFGASVMVVDHPSQDVKRVVEELEAAGHRSVGHTLDLLDTAATARVIDVALDAFGSLEILVNNAGINLKSDLAASTIEAWNEMWTVNVTAAFVLARAAADAQGSRGGSLSIVNTSSIAGSSALGRGNIGFSATKAALNELTRELAVEWGPRGIRVNAIQPCQVEVPGFARMAESDDGRETIARMVGGIPLGRFAKPEEMVGAVIFLASDASSMVTGTVIPIDGGNLALNAGGTVPR
jgi:NAD(P)-dependent dehydrogenase (short-subunit alcohol dehydrogenase family)